MTLLPVTSTLAWPSRPSSQSGPSSTLNSLPPPSPPHPSPFLKTYLIFLPSYPPLPFPQPSDQRLDGPQVRSEYPAFTFLLILLTNATTDILLPFCGGSVLSQSKISSVDTHGPRVSANTLPMRLEVPLFAHCPPAMPLHPQFDSEHVPPTGAPICCPCEDTARD